MTVRELFNDILSRAPALEHREAQVRMAEEVYRTLGEGGHLILEAGTGIGKTLAYLVPLFLLLQGTDRRACVVTYTKTLQDQIVTKDIPFLQTLLGGDAGIRPGVAFGSANYLCLTRFERYRESLFNEEADTVEEWMGETSQGLLSELDLPSQTTQDLGRDPDHCLRRKCGNYSGCFYYHSRHRLRGKNLLVLNQHLFFASLTSASDVLPKIDFVIFDEAHQTEEVASAFFQTELSSRRVRWFLDTAWKRRESVLGVYGIDRRLAAEVFGRVEREVDSFFKFLVNELDVRDRLRVRSEIRYDLDPLASSVAEARSLLEKLGKSIPEDMEEFAAEVGNIVKFLDGILSSARAFVRRERPDDIYIVERTARDVSVRIVPLTVGPLFETQVLDRFKSVVFTSATLSVAGRFDHFRSVISADGREIRSVIAPSAFDFRSKVRLFVPPREEGAHADPESLTLEIARLCRLTAGGTFVLFTNNRLLGQTWEILSKDLEFPVLRQERGVSNYKLIEEFKRAGNAVLLGSMTFWQGVDIAGGKLRGVIITHLPFSVPTDPVIEARGEYFQRLTGSSFSTYYLPKAVLLLKQGFGRLVRGREDSGFVAILDSRIVTRSYGRVFLESLPDVPVLSDIGELEEFLRSRN